VTPAAVRHLVRFSLWTAVLVGAARALLAMRSPSLVVPVGSYGAFSDWLAQASPPDMAIGLLRLAALAAIFYLLAVTLLGVVARAARLRGLAAAVDRISPAIVRRVVTGGSGIGLVLGGLVGSLPAPAIVSPTTPAAVATSSGVAGPDIGSLTTADMVRLPEAIATMTRLVDTDTDTGEPPSFDPSAAGPDGVATTLGQVDEPSPAPATMTRLDPPSGDGAEPLAAGAPPAAYDPPPPLHPAGSDWTVAPGDSLWSVAEVVMAGPDGSPADERTVARYWRHLIEANRAGLVDPGNPDLLTPGQQLTLPPPA
jgi:hypothetical protein